MENERKRRQCVLFFLFFSLTGLFLLFSFVYLLFVSFFRDCLLSASKFSLPLSTRRRNGQREGRKEKEELREEAGMGTSWLHELSDCSVRGGMGTPWLIDRTFCMLSFSCHCAAAVLLSLGGGEPAESFSSFFLVCVHVIRVSLISVGLSVSRKETEGRKRHEEGKGSKKAV